MTAVTNPVAVVTPDSEFAVRALVALALPVGETPGLWRDEYLTIDPSKVVHDVAQAGASVAFLGPGLARSYLLSLAEAFDREHPEICVVLVTKPGASLWQQAIRAGVRDVLAPDAESAEISSVGKRAMEAVARRRDNVVGEATTGRGARVITVMAPKGGSGKTMVATNLAVGLAAHMPGQVAIVDFDLRFGDVTSSLQLTPEHTLVDVARASEEIDGMMLKVLLSSHPSGLYALCAPESPGDADDIGDTHTSRSLALLAQEFQIVVVDTAGGLDEHTLAAAEQSTDLVFVCTMDVSSVRGLRKELDALNAIGLTNARRHFVLNRAESRVGLDQADIESVVGLKADVSIPSSRAVPISLNQGVTLLESDPRSPAGMELQRLVNRFLDHPEPLVVSRRERRKRWGR